MAEKQDVAGPEERREPTAEREDREQQAREALRRLRRIGEDLPAVDAAALVREGRDSAERGRR
jgi:hypothetical protein